CHWIGEVDRLLAGEGRRDGESRHRNDHTSIFQQRQSARQLVHERHGLSPCSGPAIAIRKKTAASPDSGRFAGGPADEANVFRGSPVTLRHRLSTVLL